jgi:predicted GNAT family acetyltransferase
MTPPIRILVPGDESILDAFLAEHSDSSMFMRSNLRAVGLVYNGAPLEARWVAAFEGERIAAVAAHAWHGGVVLQAPRLVPEVTRAAVAASGRAVTALFGPWNQIVAARDALGVRPEDVQWETHDDLLAVELAQLDVPPALRSGRVSCERADRAEFERLVAWRIGFSVETLQKPHGPALEAQARDEVERSLRDRSLYLLREDGTPVSTATLTARTPDCVLVGGVWTPPELRGRGLARAVVAGALLDARSEGATRSVLFTGQENRSAQQVYRTLGYRLVGDYGIMRLAAGA